MTCSIHFTNDNYALRFSLTRGNNRSSVSPSLLFLFISPLRFLCVLQASMKLNRKLQSTAGDRQANKTRQAKQAGQGREGKEGKEEEEGVQRAITDQTVIASVMAYADKVPPVRSTRRGKEHQSDYMIYTAGS